MTSSSLWLLLVEVVVVVVVLLLLLLQVAGAGEFLDSGGVASESWEGGREGGR